MRKTYVAAATLGVLALAALVGYRESELTIRDRWPVVACTMEAKICPDGTAVGRQGPSCEFAPCPHAEPAKDPACDGEANEYYSLGFGIEHRYEGEIVPGKPVVAVLSCDHSRLTISGAVSQVVDASGSDDFGGEIADLSGGELVVSLADDYNFDGHNDLSSIVSNGQGVSGIDTYAVYLYDPASSKFAYSAELSDLENLSPNPKERRIEQEFCYYESEQDEVTCDRTYHRWQAGRLVEVAS